MANYGIKIMKPGKNISSTNITDHVFWSKYPPLSILEKKTQTINVTTSSYQGTVNVSHSYGFRPLVMGFVTKTDGSPTSGNGERNLMPCRNFAGINCDIGLFQLFTFNYRVLTDKVEIYYNATCVIMGTEDPPLSGATFKVELYFFMWELGSAWN